MTGEVVNPKMTAQLGKKFGQLSSDCAVVESGFAVLRYSLQ